MGARIVPFRVQMHTDEDCGDHVARGDGEIRAESLHDDGREAAGGGCHHEELRQQHRTQMRLERAQTCLQREDGQRGGRTARVAEQQGRDVAQNGLTRWPRPGRGRTDRRDQPAHR